MKPIPLILNILLFYIAYLQSSTILNSNGITQCKDKSSSIVHINEMSVTIDLSNKVVNANIKGSVTKSLDSAKVQLQFSFYGFKFDMPLDLCHIASSNNICPIPKGDFEYPYSLSIPDSVPSEADLLLKFPGSDLKVTIKLEDASGNDLGCVDVGLANPATAYQKGIVGASAGIAATVGSGALVASIGSIVSSALPATGSASLAQMRPGMSPSFGDVINTFQFFATSGMLSLTYPPVYEQFSRNFGWSMGFIQLGNLEIALENFRGNQIDEDGKVLLERRGLDLMPNMNATSYSQLSGIDSYSQKLGIQSKNYFMTVLIIFLIVMAAVTVLSLLLRLGLEFLSKYKPKMFSNLRNHFAQYYIGNLLRIFALCYFILATAALFQFTKSDNWRVTLLAAILLGIFCLGLTGFVTFRIIRNGPEKLYSAQDLQYKYGALYTDYRPSVYIFFIPVLVAAVMRAIAVGLLSDYIWAQMSILVITEILFFSALYFWRPYASKVSNRLMIFISVMRLLNTALLFCFIESVNLSPLARTIIGLAMIITQGIMILAIVAMTIWSITIVIRKMVKEHKESNEQKDRQMSQHSLSSLGEKEHDKDSKSILEELEDSEPPVLFRKSSLLASNPECGPLLNNNVDEVNKPNKVRLV